MGATDIAESESVAQARAIVLRRLAGHGARVFLFGSRARSDGHPGSDIDIAVLPEQPLPAGLLGELREALEESTIPQTVDVVDLSETDSDFRTRVLAEGIEWHA